MNALPLGRGTDFPPNAYDKRDNDKFLHLLYQKFINLKYLNKIRNIRNSKLKEKKEFYTPFDSQEQMENDMFWRGDLEDDMSEIVEKKVFSEDDPRSRERKSAFYNREKDLLSHYLEHFGPDRGEMSLSEDFTEVGESYENENNDETKITEMLENGVDSDSVHDCKIEENVIIVQETKIEEEPVTFSEFIEQKTFKEDEQNKEIEETKEVKNVEEKVEIKQEKEEKSEVFTISFGNMFKKDKKQDEKEIIEDKKEKEELKEVEEEMVEMVEQEVQVMGKIEDETSVTYISKDKMFLITGTKGGFVNIWAFLEPYPSTKMKKVEDYIKEKRRMSLGGDKVILEVEDQEKINEEDEIEEEEMEFRRPEVLGWSEIYREPDYSFVAHDSEVKSIQITPKRFSKNQVDYIIVTTSKDKTVKVWKLINLVKVIKKSQENKELYNDKNEKHQIKLEMMGWLGGEEYVDAVFIPNTSKEVIVTKENGIIEKYEINSTKEVAKEWDKTNMKMKNQIEEEEKWTIGSISTSCNYYAVGGQTGLVNIYDVKNLNLIGSYLCRNRKGSNKKGGRVTGLEWNKKDNLILVTTLDSRIRMLSFTNMNKKILGFEVGMDLKGKEESEVEQMKLEYVEKFKGHTNKRKQFKSRFIGVNEQLIMCPSENGQIVFWQITNDPSRRDEEDENINEEMEEEIGVKNTNTISLKVENKELLERMNVFNKSEWDKLVEVLIKSKEIEAYEPEKGRGCLGCKKSIKSQNIDPINSLLIVTSENGWQLKYTTIDTRYFE